MARILVAPPDSVTGRQAADRLAARLRSDGHEATRVGGDILSAIKEADAAAVILDGAGPGTLVAAAAAALRKPVIAFVGPDAPRHFQWPLVTYQPGIEESDWWVALAPWYETIRPFAGRVVRDLIPQLVRDAGHHVTFHAATPDDRPRHLKAKVLAEAEELVAAAAGEEKEEIADLLEALEAFIRARGYDREGLKRIKEAKRKQRGGFDRCWVVEETTSHAADPEAATAEGGPAAAARAGPGAEQKTEPEAERKTERKTERETERQAEADAPARDRRPSEVFEV